MWQKQPSTKFGASCSVSPINMAGMAILASYKGSGEYG